MAGFTTWLSSRALTSVAPHWFSPAISSDGGVDSYFAAYTEAYNGVAPYNVTLTRTQVDYFGNIVQDTAPVASYNTGTNFNYIADRITPDEQAVVYTTATAAGAAGTTDLVIQGYDNAGQPIGSPATLVSGIANYRALADGTGATFGTKEFLAYGTFDATANSETIHLLAYNTDGTPIPSESGILDSFATGNDLYDPFGFGTLLGSTTADPSFIYLKGYEENGADGVNYQQVSTDGAPEGSGYFVHPLYPAGSTNQDLGRWEWTRLLSPTAGGNDLAIAMPYSYTDTTGTTHYALDVRFLNTATAKGVDDTIALAQSSDTAVTVTRMPDGGLVVGYTDNGTAYVRQYNAGGAEIAASSYALPAGTTSFNLLSLGDGRVAVEFPATETGGNQLYYAIYDTRQTGITVDTSRQSTPSLIAGTVFNDIFYVGGASGTDVFVGAGGTDFLVTTEAAGTGTVVADLRDGTVSRGNQLDARIFGVQGVQLGADPSVVLGLTSGTDLLYGGSGAASFYGEGGTDYIRGGTGSNSVVGGSGNEIFYGSGGSDTMLGGKAQNFMQAGSMAGSTDVFYGNGGTDFVYGGAGSTELIGGGGIEDLTGGSGFNELIGSTGSAGFDVFNGGSGTDLFYAGIGTNLLEEANGTDVFVGNAGTDYVYGGAGRSFVYGSTGTDVVTTGSGSQYVQAGSGHTVFNDTAAFLSAGRTDEIDNFAGGQGTDLYLPTAVQGTTSFVSQNGGTAVVTAVNGGKAEIFASKTDLATVQAHTHFTL